MFSGNGGYSSRPSEQHIDPILQSFVRYADKRDDYSKPLTLNVNGLIVTGFLISRNQYKQGMREIHNIKDDQELLDNDMDDDPLYIHMKNVRFLVTSTESIPDFAEGFLWRCKLSSVDGFVPVAVRHGYKPPSYPQILFEILRETVTKLQTEITERVRRIWNQIKALF